MPKKIVFMGTPMFAVPILKSLYQNGYPISDVYTQPPQKSQRGQQINKSPIQGIAETLNLEYRTPKSLKDNKEELEYFKNIDADLAIVVAYGQIIPKEFLDLTKKGFINIHASLLPKWRGAAPIQRSVMNLDIETGISIKSWYDESRKFLPEGTILMQSSTSHVLPMPAYLYGKGTWAAIDTLFFMPDLPMTFMGELEGQVYKIGEVATVFQQEQ